MLYTIHYVVYIIPTETPNSEGNGSNWTTGDNHCVQSLRIMIACNHYVQSSCVILA